MKWLISLFLSRIFAYLHKWADKSETILDDNTLQILEPRMKSMLEGKLDPKDAAISFIGAELQMLINYAISNKGDKEIWKHLKSIQCIVSALDFEKK